MRFLKLVLTLQACVFLLTNADTLFFNHSGRDLIINGKKIIQNEDLYVKLQEGQKIEISEKAGIDRIIIMPVCRKSLSMVRGRSIARTICDNFKEVEAHGLQVVPFDFSREDGSVAKAYEIKAQ